jgi:N-acetylglucosamine kinase-like BadF-type ATPase
MSSSKLTLGIDAGGTTSRAVALDGDRVVWEANGPGVNVSTLDDAEIALRLTSLLMGCPNSASACGAFAGMVTTSQRANVESAMRTTLPSAEVSAVADFEAALEACAPEANVCVISGTGSIVCSRFDGDVKRTGGRGYVLGDEGSGFQFGRDAMLAFLDGSGEEVSSGLTEAVESAFGTTKKPEVIAALYAGGSIPTRLASLAPALAADADRGAIYALKSLRTNMAKLAHVCRQHVRRYGPDEPTLGCQGGLWASTIYRQAFLDAVPLWLEMPLDRVRFDLRAPVFGAARLARKALVD